jgi:Uma2 family endonuclease
VKAALYAAAGVPEYWIVNLVDRCVEVHREPDAAARRYRTTALAGQDDDLASTAVPEIRIRVSDLLN